MKEKANLKYCPNGNCYVIKEDGAITLYSYTTAVANIDKQGYLSIRGKYSVTTIRHISAFVREYAMGALRDWHVKGWEWLIDMHCAINVHTGEVSDWGLWKWPARYGPRGGNR